MFFTRLEYQGYYSYLHRDIDTGLYNGILVNKGKVHTYYSGDSIDKLILSFEATVNKIIKEDKLETICSKMEPTDQ